MLGSLLNPAKTDAAKLVRWNDLGGALEQALKQEQGEERREAAVVAQGLAKAATLLAGRYQWVITNVPYLARGKQNKRLRDFCEQHYSAAKNDLATVFLDRCLELCIDRGTASIVLPQNWLFLSSYKKLREKLLKNEAWHLIARLGSGAFETISGEVVKAILISLSRANLTKESGDLFGDSYDGNLIRGVDVSKPRTAAEKAAQLVTAEVKNVEQASQTRNPDVSISFEERSTHNPLSDFSESYQGASTLDVKRFRFNFWEIEHSKDWLYHMSTPSGDAMFTGLNYVSCSRESGGAMQKLAAQMKEEGFLGGWLSGNKAWGRRGIACSWMNTLPATPYFGCVYDNMAAVIVPNNQKQLPAIWAFCSSKAFNQEVRKINQKVQVANSTLVKVPFDIDHWSKVSEKRFPNGLPNPYTDDPTQWIFHGQPCGSVIWDAGNNWTTHGLPRTDDSVLQVTVARLLGYRWPAELDANVELADEQREWVNRCETLASFADDDGIVCIPPVRGEASASDRLLNLLAAAFGDAWSNDILAALLKSAGHEGKTLETWLREKFFAQHSKLFRQRPFIWHIWDGLRDGFAALVNYHKLDAKLLETLIYTYVGDWISRQKQDIASGVDGAQERLASAENLKKKLELIREGEAPYDIFVRWKPLEEQPIGWNPDLNDGVRLNIRPFLTVPDVGKKGAGVLRDKPNIKWNKDRGKDVESAPWYHMFKGDRINDHHLALADKRAAREQNHA